MILLWKYFVFVSINLQGKIGYNYFCSPYDRVPLCAPPTMGTIDYNNTSFIREGFILSLSLEDGSVGYGEVSIGQIYLTLLHVVLDAN